jgi:hypothetical protein
MNIILFKNYYLLIIFQIIHKGKGKKALENEWNEAVMAADSGSRLTTSASNTPKVSSNYIPPKPKGERTVDETELASRSTKRGGGKKKK